LAAWPPAGFGIHVVDVGLPVFARPC
jgi:hypothetical protein